MPRGRLGGSGLEGRLGGAIPGLARAMGSEGGRSFKPMRPTLEITAPRPHPKTLAICEDVYLWEAHMSCSLASRWMVQKSDRGIKAPTTAGLDLLSSMPLNLKSGNRKTKSINIFRNSAKRLDVPDKDRKRAMAAKPFTPFSSVAEFSVKTLFIISRAGNLANQPQTNRSLFLVPSKPLRRINRMTDLDTIAARSR